MNLFAKAKKARENKKGFTLVELIVVLVILAILAAILVPALLGWIDEAKKKQYVLEARNVYIASQAIADEKYAAANSTKLSTGLEVADLDLTRIQTLSDITGLDINDITLGTGTDTHSKFTIKGMGIKFTSQDGTKVAARLAGDTWDVATGDSASIPGTAGSVTKEP